ncbi:hypothetical protein D5S18_19890 [Nocardia panacis]|uniref:DMT family transporter n=1 Tax=Nocardia panacis TaxID=2340916 RepID=A0A3A4KGA5_9NOCA|nr:DMT family transporter [Nocardia panacis]RJO73479.1 hypothetical protein D5S18_19890 [Nocardia panacis]
MTGNPVGAIICGLIAALMFALAAVAQQSAAAAVPEDKPLVGQLVRNPRWWAGIVGDIGGYGFQVAALALGAVLLVQPILVSALVFALPLAARLNGRRITGRTWAIAVALAGALACFLVVGNPSEGKTYAPLGDWALPLGLMIVVIAVAAVLGLRGGDPSRRALLLGAASGSLYGLAAALTEYVSTLFEHGIGHVVASWQTWALIIAGLVGFFLQQKGFQAGPLAASLPAVTIAEPLAAAYIGITVLDERFRTNTVGLVVTAAAVLVMCATTIRLSRAQAAA